MTTTDADRNKALAHLRQARSAQADGEYYEARGAHTQAQQYFDLAQWHIDNAMRYAA